MSYLIATVATETVRTRMTDAFGQAMLYELHFWATAARFQDWSL